MTTIFKSRNPPTGNGNNTTQMQKSPLPTMTTLKCKKLVGTWDLPTSFLLTCSQNKTTMKEKKKKKIALHLHLIITNTITVEIEVCMGSVLASWQRTQTSKSVSPHHQNPEVPTGSDTKTGRPRACGILVLRASVDCVTALRSTAWTSRDFNFQLRREWGNTEIERGR